MLLSKCENCKKRAFYPRIRKYNFKFLPMLRGLKSEDKLCSTCYKKVDFMIRRTHKQIKPPIWFIIRFYVGKALFNPRELTKQIYDKFRK